MTIQVNIQSFCDSRNWIDEQVRSGRFKPCAHLCIRGLAERTVRRGLASSRKVFGPYCRRGLFVWRARVRPDQEMQRDLLMMGEFDLVSCSPDCAGYAPIPERLPHPDARQVNPKWRCGIVQPADAGATMTREDEGLTIERKLVVVFDICSSTTILGDLKDTDNLASWRNLLIYLKDFLRDQGQALGVDLYKFIGDGWILLFPDKVSREKLCDFLTLLSRRFSAHFEKDIAPLLQQPVSPTGLMFGVDAGELIRLEMNEGIEYLGRAINVASRLQACTKDLPVGPSYRALFSKHSINLLGPPPNAVIFQPEKVTLRNISEAPIECFAVNTHPGFDFGGPSGAKSPNGRRRSRKKAKREAARRRARKLEIVFYDDRKPYLEEQRKGVITGNVLVDRRYRIGVRCSGINELFKGRVVLEKCEPSEADGVHLEHALSVMGQPLGTYEFVLRPGDPPGVFIDVIYDEILGGRLKDDAFGLCYAAALPSHAIRRGAYLITLRAEADGLVDRKQFRVFQNPSTQMLTMERV
jgi:class 3 adenylate cyclase